MLTVLMATRNRCDQLALTLQRYQELLAPRGGWTLIVVDNGSSDSTREVLRSFEHRLPLTWLFEPEPGKARALNKGLRYVEGELVVLTDDDVLPCGDWLLIYERAVLEYPHYAAFGGPVRPRFPYEPPVWAVADKKIAAACFGFSLNEKGTGPCGPLELLGANFAVRTEWLMQCGGFNPEVGPRPGRYAMGSEPELLMRLTKLGGHLFYVHEAWVEHVVRPEQISKRWMLKRAINLGRGYYYVSEAQSAKCIFGVPRYLFRLYLTYTLKKLAAALSADFVGAFVSHWYANYYLGHVAEAFRSQLWGRRWRP